MLYNIFMKQHTPTLQTNDVTVGKKIAKIRKLQGLTQEELATKMGIKRTTLANYETGRIRVYDSMLKAFALVLKVSADELLGLSLKAGYLDTNLSLVKKLNSIEKLPARQKAALLNTINAYLKSNKNLS